jgi:hypothetical protein
VYCLRPAKRRQRQQSVEQQLERIVKANVRDVFGHQTAAWSHYEGATQKAAPDSGQCGWPCCDTVDINDLGLVQSLNSSGMAL